MKILGVLQNQWFKDPVRAKAMLDAGVIRYGDIYRDRFIKMTLFMGCLTGRRIEAAFGPLVDDMKFCEASAEIGENANLAPEFDIDHLHATFLRLQPDIVVAFGNIAKAGVAAVLKERSFPSVPSHVLCASHPAARGPDVMKLLVHTAGHLRRILL